MVKEQLKIHHRQYMGVFREEFLSPYNSSSSKSVTVFGLTERSSPSYRCSVVARSRMELDDEQRPRSRLSHYVRILAVFLFLIYNINLLCLCHRVGFWKGRCMNIIINKQTKQNVLTGSPPPLRLSLSLSLSLSLC